MLRRFALLSFGMLVLFSVVAACGRSPGVDAARSGRLEIIATTTIVGDVVKQVAGDALEVEVLLPPGIDPHGFQPTPQDVVRIAEADVIFANGAGLEEFLEPMLKNAGGNAEVVYVSEGISLLEAEEVHGHEGESESEAEEHAEGDPHTWFDPNNVILWTENIERKLSTLDPSNASSYAANASDYQDQLIELDAWIQGEVSQLPEANRQLVTDHTSFTYFTSRYGFEQVGAVIPSYSTLSEPSAQELAILEDAIRDLGVKAIFVGENASPGLMERVAKDTGVQLISLYNGSLSGPDGPAPNYLEFMRYNVSVIVEALK